MSEKRYRDLSGGEELEIGDEWAMPGRDIWTPVEMRDVGEIAPYPHYRRFRRPIAEPTEEDSSPAENGGEVGTPRCDAASFTFPSIIVNEETVHTHGTFVYADFARQLERETVDLQRRLEGLANAACATCEERDNAKKERDEWRDAWRGLRDAVYGVVNAPTQNFAMVEERANEWRELAGKLAVVLGKVQEANPYNYNSDEWEQASKSVDAALAAYELKAKEGV